MTSMTTNTLFNAVLFQAIWLALVITANNPYYWVGPASAALVLALLMPQIQRAKLLAPLAGVAVIGFGFDMLIHMSGVITLVENPMSFTWLLLLWLFFVAMFHQVFAWLTRFNLILVFSIGAIGGPLAYYSASLLEAVEIHNMPIFLLLYSLFWGIGFVIAAVIMVARRLNKSKTLEP